MALPEGLALMMSPSKKGGVAGAEAETDMEETEERSLARAAFQALKDDDEDAFVDAFEGAVQACAMKVAAPAELDDEEEA